MSGSNITAGLQVSSSQTAPPHRLVIISNGTHPIRSGCNNDSSFSIFLIQQDKYLFAVAMSKELEVSMFTRLYFMQGEV
jgi:dolichyl-diphosphooligosaccharide--protein glycosyltransferase